MWKLWDPYIWRHCQSPQLKMEHKYKVNSVKLGCPVYQSSGVGGKEAC